MYIVNIYTRTSAVHSQMYVYYMWVHTLVGDGSLVEGLVESSPPDESVKSEATVPDPPTSSKVRPQLFYRHF